MCVHHMYVWDYGIIFSSKVKCTQMLINSERLLSLCSFKLVVYFYSLRLSLRSSASASTSASQSAGTKGKHHHGVHNRASDSPGTAVTNGCPRGC